jgi:iron only hydrogenase large subunit-like protein/uncharacterized Fe-S cluster-containing protein
MKTSAQQVVYTLAARCRDCYRCLRACPVKAIRMEDGQAFVDEERCIGCGTCIRECPQKAKTCRNDVERAEKCLEEGVPVAVSLAPSFAGLFEPWEHRRLVAAFRQMGITYVGETSIGATPVARASRQQTALRTAEGSVCTACPAVVNYVEKYHADKLSALLPIASPMIAHARHIRKKLGDPCRVIFIGPCVAKKVEIERADYAGLVDVALTFGELQEWLAKRGVDLARCEESDFDEEPEGDSRLFPLPGGLARTAAMDSGSLAPEVLQVSGFRRVNEALDSLRPGGPPVLVEPLFCPEGCINGPGIPEGRNLFDRRRRVLDYAHKPRGLAPIAATEGLDLAARFAAGTRRPMRPYTEEDILRVLDRTGKSDPAQQLNCGACGYDTCRDKAVAVLQGMAEPEMCIPYMRRLAEQRTDRIIETSPNGILILDESLNILSMNPAFRRFFVCGDPLLGRRISSLMDPAPFEKLATGVLDHLELNVDHSPYGLICHELLYTLREEKQYVGIFIDMTAFQASERKLEDLQHQTVAQARQLLENQITMAEKIAEFLGQHTASSEQLVEKLIELSHENGKKA